MPVIYPSVNNEVACFWFDFDNDNDLDIYYSGGGCEENYLYENMGNDVFLNVDISYMDSGDLSAIIDYNNDGFIDIIITNYFQTRIYSNNGDRTFSELLGISL